MEDDGKELVVQCCVCLECFDEEGDKRPVIRICGHSCCVGCSKKITAAPSNKCPVCNAVVTPKKGKEKVVINYQLIEQIRNQKEMVRRLAKMEKEHLENECQVNELKTKVSQAEEYEKFFKCLECKFPMKEGFFCLTCIRATVDAVEDYSDEELTEFISKVICGGCLKKHEKKEHETAELDEIKKKQHKKKFRKTLKEKIDKITSDFDLIKNVLGTVDGKMQRMLDAVAGAAISLPFDQTVSMLRMEREVIDNLNTFGSSLNLLVSESYHLQQHVEGVTQSSDSLASIPPAPPMTGAIKEECRDDYGSALGAMYASPPMPSPMSISAPRPSPEPQTPTTSFKRKKDGPSGIKRPRKQSDPSRDLQ